MKEFTLNYQTGAGNSEHDTIEEAMQAVAPAYTQKSIIIENKKGNEVARLPWYGVEYDPEEDEEPFARFGSFGYYGKWVIL